MSVCLLFYPAERGAHRQLKSAEIWTFCSPFCDEEPYRVGLTPGGAANESASAAPRSCRLNRLQQRNGERSKPSEKKRQVFLFTTTADKNSSLRGPIEEDQRWPLAAWFWAVGLQVSSAIRALAVSFFKGSWRVLFSKLCQQRSETFVMRTQVE